MIAQVYSTKTLNTVRQIILQNRVDLQSLSLHTTLFHF